MRPYAALLLVCAAAPAIAQPQLSPSATWAARLAAQYQKIPDITYLTANNYEARLDVYKRIDVTDPQPTLIWIHGGGWVAGNKEADVAHFIPFLEMGWNVVNVEYRLGKVSPAPAAVEDCLCALRWVGANAKAHNIDTKRLVVSGGSAGGHLSLATGMIDESAGLDRQCPGGALPKLAAIINWYGITDVADLLDGPNRKSYAVAWLGSRPDRVEVARRVSPMTYVRSGLPAILTIHGDADPTVPYTHATQLHEALKKAGVVNQLYTVAGGKHGRFAAGERVRIYGVIREFLSRNGLGTK
jgi:acetyl esterase/lipase